MPILLGRAAVLLCLTSVATSAGAAPLTAGERQRLVAHLEITERWLASELDGLSPAQLAFGPSPESWSVKDVVEHLGIAEPQYWTQVQDALKPPATGYTAETTDATILWYGIDRGNRATTGEACVPDGRFKTAADALASFRALRVKMIEHASTILEDLRGRKLTGGTMDVYQWCLMISTHSMRHILQIREFKAAPTYPRA